MVNGSSGKFTSQLHDHCVGRRCTLLWIGATATTVVAIATCVGAFCRWLVLSGASSSGYAWDLWATTPDCNGCANPWSADPKRPGEWYRHDYMQDPPPPEPKPAPDGGVR